MARIWIEPIVIEPPNQDHRTTLAFDIGEEWRHPSTRAE